MSLRIDRIYVIACQVPVQVHFFFWRSVFKDIPIKHCMIILLWYTLFCIQLREVMIKRVTFCRNYLTRLLHDKFLCAILIIVVRQNLLQNFELADFDETETLTTTIINYSTVSDRVDSCYDRDTTRTYFNASHIMLWAKLGRLQREKILFFPTICDCCCFFFFFFVRQLFVQFTEHRVFVIIVYSNILF